MITLTEPRQVRLRGCNIYSPGMESRAVDAAHRAKLLSGVDITPYIRRIDIYESIFNNTLSGSLLVMEDVGLIEHIPIVGVELLAISFAVEDSDGQEQVFRNAFRVTKVHNVSYPRHQLRLYNIEFVSQEFVRSVGGRRISRRFVDKSAAEAVRDVLTQDLGYQGNLDIEPTDGKLDVTLPNYTGLQAINFFALMSRTVGTPHESNFLFYETLHGYHFNSISKLIRDGKARKDTLTFTMDSSIAAVPKLEDELARNAASRMFQEQTFDLLQDIASGTLRAGVLHFDPLARRVSGTPRLPKPEDSRYTETFTQTTHLADHPVYPKNYDKYIGEDVRLFTVPTNLWTANSAYVKSKGVVPYEHTLRQSIVLRNRQLREIQHIRTLLDLPGRPELRAGAVVDVNYPATRLSNDVDSSINDSLSNKPTPLHSGLHLVADVHHIITITEQNAAVYRMNLKVVRDSFNAPLIGTT